VVFARELSIEEGQRLQRIARMSRQPIRLRRAAIVLAEHQDLDAIEGSTVRGEEIARSTGHQAKSDRPSNRSRLRGAPGRTHNRSALDESAGQSFVVIEATVKLSARGGSK
jgi:hypothetical protein